MNPKSQARLVAANAFVLFVALISLVPLPAVARTSSEPSKRAVELEAPFQGGFFSAGEKGLLTGGFVSLVEYIRQHIEDLDVENPINSSIPRYERKKHFGSWVRPPAGKFSGSDCLDVRALVLIRDSDPKVKIEFRNSENCVVASGLWHDPYSGEDFESAEDIDVDHMVPLKHAYYTGAHAWSPEKRCHYANYLKNVFHLKAVSAHENSSKSDRGPERYLPPAESFHCQYVNEWMKIKMIWGLAATRDEVETVEAVVERHRCGEALKLISKRELDEQRLHVEQTQESCENFGQKANR